MNARMLLILSISSAFLLQPASSLSQTPQPLSQMASFFSQPPQSSPARRPGLRRQVELISRAARGRVGAAVMLLETGEAFDFNGGARSPMQSVYKLPIGMALLRRVDEGAIKLDERVRVEKSDLVPAALYSPIRDKYPQGGTELSVGELLRAMLVESDGTASDILLRLGGGPARVNEFLWGLGVGGIVVATTEKAMAADRLVQYRNHATPLAVLKLLRFVQEGRGLSASSHALLLQLMTECVTGPHRLKGLLPAGTPVAHKTGSSGTAGGVAAATNDVGIITLPDGRHLLVAVFVSDSRADEQTRERVIAEIARAAWDWAV
jgi:beta-lactamase class A